MKLVLKNEENGENKRTNIYKKDVPCLDSAWHYHAEYEILYVAQSSGFRFVGDNVSYFAPGELVLVGPYLPHLWRNDITYYQDNGELSVKVFVLKFTKDFLGSDTFDNSEFAGINEMLEQSNFGILFKKKLSKKLHNEFIEIVDLPKIEQSIRLLEILYKLSLTKEQDRTILSSTDMRQYTDDNPHRLDLVVKYISDNYQSYITLADVSDIACLTPNSFCRFFKKMTNKSFTEFLNEVRIKNAARMLYQDNMSISEVCFNVGYKSIPNFNKQFKEIMGNTPKAYRNL